MFEIKVYGYIAADGRRFLNNATNCVKGTSGIPESYLPYLTASCENMASYHEWIMEKTRQIQIVYAGPNLCQHSTTHLARGIMMNECSIQFITKEQVKLVSLI